MKYYPLFLKLAGKRVVFSGASDHAAAKIKLLLKTEAEIKVLGLQPCEDVKCWAENNLISLEERRIQRDDVIGTALVYGANDDAELDDYAVQLGKAAGALTNIVDNLDASEFLTPAIVDRDPVVVAIGTEGTAPVLARKIKREVEDLLPLSTGVLARIATGFRMKAAKIGSSQARRGFWSRFFNDVGPKALASDGEIGVSTALENMLNKPRFEEISLGHVEFIGAGPGDPELLTLKARRLLHDADVVLHDRLVTKEILELARREAIVRSVGKQGFGQSWKQEDINELMVSQAQKGLKVVRLKSGDATIFGRLDEEIVALEAANIPWSIVPGITSASAAVASMGTSMTRRGRNASVQFLTAHDMQGYAEQDWNNLAKPDAIAAIYMGIKAAHFLAGRLLMRGASGKTPITVVENASRSDERMISTTLADLPNDMKIADLVGPAIIFLGLTPQSAKQVQLTKPSATPVDAVGSAR